MFVTQADFDKRHKYYRAILRDDKELAKELGCDSTTIYRNRKLLIKKGLLYEEDGVTKVSNFVLFELEWTKILAKHSPAIMQEMFATINKKTAKEDTILANMQKEQAQDTEQSFNVSSKDDLPFSEEDMKYINDNLEQEDNDE